MTLNPDLHEQHILSKVYEILQSRKTGDPATSYVAALYAKGTDKICGKIAEEGAELTAQAVRENPEEIAHECADLLFHVMVLLAHTNVSPDSVFAKLEARFGTSGHAEKAARG